MLEQSTLNRIREFFGGAMFSPQPQHHQQNYDGISNSNDLTMSRSQVDEQMNKFRLMPLGVEPLTDKSAILTCMLRLPQKGEGGSSPFFIASARVKFYSTSYNRDLDQSFLRPI